MQVLCCCQNPKTPQEIFTWNINIDEARSYSFNELFSEYKVISLETSKRSNFGGITDLKMMNDNYIITTSEGRETKILIFNENGEFVWKSSIGKGPSEIRMIQGYCINDNPIIVCAKFK